MSSEIELPLVTTPEYEGYFLDDIEKYLGGPFNKECRDFLRWLSGQTCGIYQGKEVVYKWDFDNWMTSKGKYKNAEEWD